MHVVVAIMGALSIASLVFVGWGLYDSDHKRIIDSSRRHELHGKTIDSLQRKVTDHLETCQTTEHEKILRACRSTWPRSDHVYFLTATGQHYFLETKSGKVVKVALLP